MYSDISQSNQDYSKPDSNPQVSKSVCSCDKNEIECNFEHVLRRQSDSSVSQGNLLPLQYASEIEQSDNICEGEQKQIKFDQEYPTIFSNLPNLGQLNNHDISIYINSATPALNHQQMLLSMKPQPEQALLATNNLLITQSKPEKRSQAIKDRGRGTKNIIKNFGRNTITFVEASKYLFCDQFKKMGKNYLQYLPKLTRIRERINTISDMRNLWMDNEHGKLMRRISEHYFRKQALSYVFNSHVKPDVYVDHIQCRRKLREALRDPSNFTNLK